MVSLPEKTVDTLQEARELVLDDHFGELESQCFDPQDGVGHAMCGIAALYVGSDYPTDGLLRATASTIANLMHLSKEGSVSFQGTLESGRMHFEDEKSPSAKENLSETLSQNAAKQLKMAKQAVINYQIQEGETGETAVGKLAARSGLASTIVSTDYPGIELQSGIGDTIANLMHRCRAAGTVSFESALKEGRRQFNEEKSG